MSNRAAGQGRHHGSRATFTELNSPRALQRNQRIADQAARDAVAAMRRTINATAPEQVSCSGAG